MRIGFAFKRFKILGLCSERESQVLRSFLLLPQCVLDLKSYLSESIKPDFLGRTKSFPACFLSSYAATVF